MYTWNFFYVLAILVLHSYNADGQIPGTANKFSVVPQYRFHYYVRDDKTGDYKMQEEHKISDKVKGSYSVAEPNRDLRVVKYMADVANGFKADANIQTGASLVKTTTNPFYEIPPFNNYRTGLAPNRYNYNSPNVLNPIVVPQLIPNQNSINNEKQFPYHIERNSTDKQQNITEEYTTSPKSIQVELNYKDELGVELVKTKEETTISVPNNIEKETQNLSKYEVSNESKDEDQPSVSNLVLESGEIKPSTTDFPQNEKLDEIPRIPKPMEGDFAVSEESAIPPNGITGPFKYGNLDITSSLMDIINKNKGSFNIKNNGKQNYETETQIPTQQTTEIYDVPKKITSSYRPIRLVGLNPIFLDHYQLQTLSDYPTSFHQLHFEPISNVQYATQSPFLNGLLSGPTFKTFPYSILNTTNQMMEINKPASIPITAPIISNPYLGASVGDKVETKLEKSLPLCTDCILPPSYVTYPMNPPPMRPVQPNPKSCQHQDHEYPLWNPFQVPYKSGIAFMLVTPQINKNQI